MSSEGVTGRGLGIGGSVLSRAVREIGSVAISVVAKAPFLFGFFAFLVIKGDPSVSTSSRVKFFLFALPCDVNP